MRGAMMLWLVTQVTAAVAAPRAPEPGVEVHVDPRVEILSVLFYLAGSPEYRRAFDTSYRRAVDAHFAPFRNHPAVAATQNLRAKNGISHNAPPTLAVQLDDHELTPRVELTPLPEGVDERWRTVDIPAYLKQVKDFAAATGFAGFFAGQRTYFSRVEARFSAAVDAARVNAWFDDFFGPRAGARFVLCPGLLTGPWSYEATAHLGRGREEIFQVVALEGLDADSLPVPTAQTIDLVVHERAHAYVNPVVERHVDELASAAAPVFASAKAVMERQSYKTPKVMVQESIVRALRVLYVRDRRGAEGQTAAVRDEESRGFLWTTALAERLARLRGKGRLDLEGHVPALAAFFADWAASGKKVAPTAAPP